MLNTSKATDTMDSVVYISTAAHKWFHVSLTNTLTVAQVAQIHDVSSITCCSAINENLILSAYSYSGYSTPLYSTSLYNEWKMDRFILHGISHIDVLAKLQLVQSIFSSCDRYCVIRIYLHGWFINLWQFWIHIFVVDYNINR